MSSTIQPLNDTSDLVEFYKPMSLYLKPIARLNITVQLPQLKEPGKVISNWDIMEKIKRLIKPNQFSYIKVSKSTVEFVRFEAEFDNREILKKAIKALDGNNLKMIGFFESFKVKACEAKLDFPVRHDWDSFFRDAVNMDEMKPGERPDTAYFAYIPKKWFIETDNINKRSTTSKSAADIKLPSEKLLRRLFETFGEIRCVDIPISDPYRTRMANVKTGFRISNSAGSNGFISSNFTAASAATNNSNSGSSDLLSLAGAVGGGNISGGNQELTFEAYVQFVEYISFVRAMDTLRGMKWVFHSAKDDENRFWSADIKVDFDRTKHLSDKNIRKRRLQRERLVAIDTAIEQERRRREEELRRRLEAERSELERTRSAAERAKLERRRAREEARRIKQLELKRKKAADAIERRIRLEEQKLLLAQRKLESVRLLTELFRRCQAIEQKRQVDRSLKELEDAQWRENMERERLARQEEETRQRLLKKMEENLRNKMVRSLNDMEDKKRSHKREVLCKSLHQSGVVLRSTVAAERLPPAPPSRRSYPDQFEDQDDGHYDYDYSISPKRTRLSM